MLVFGVVVFVAGMAFIVGWDLGLRDGMGGNRPSQPRSRESPRPHSHTPIVEVPDTAIRVVSEPETDLLLSREIDGGEAILEELTPEPPSPEPMSDAVILVVEHVVDPYWTEMNWEPDGNRLRGWYRTQFGSFRGDVENWQSREPGFHIENPPSALRQHPHWACFRPCGNGRYWVHFRDLPRSIDRGIIEIESVLTQALGHSRRTRRDHVQHA